MANNQPQPPLEVGLSRGIRRKSVKILQDFLRRYGYLDPPPAGDPYTAIRASFPAPVANRGEFDSATVTAVSKYQRVHGLPVTGELDQATVTQMSKPRCGFPDIALDSPRPAFVAEGDRWTKMDLTYRFLNFTAHLTETETRNAIKQAFDLWSAVTPLTFSEVGGAADIDIRFVSLGHGDGRPFDGPGSELAHAFYPPPGGGNLAGDAHFDEDESWTGNCSSLDIDLETVAAHEFGHSLGLAHSPDPHALMYETYHGPHCFLSEDDISGIQAIYPKFVEIGNLLHLAGPTADSHLWHTIRFANEFTWQDFRDVEDVAGHQGEFIDVDCSIVNGQLHICGVTSDGNLWHTIRFGKFSGWQGFGDVRNAVPPPKIPSDEKVLRVAAAEVAGDLHVCILTGSGKLYHTIRFSQSSQWQFFGDVLTVTGPPDDGNSIFVDVGCAGVKNELHVVVVNQSGNLYHTIRHSNSWQFLGNVRTVAGPPFLQEKFKRVAAGELDDELHVCATTKISKKKGKGKLYHTIRRESGWQFFGDVSEKTGIPSSGSFVDVSCAQSGGELHVVGTTNVGGLWHTIRHNVGWDKLGDVEKSNAGERGSFSAVSVAGLFIP